MDKKNEELGAYLNELRYKSRLSGQKVEELSVAIAEAKNDTRFHVSTSYLNRIERGFVDTPSSYKLRTLAEIYGENVTLLLQKAGILDDSHKKDLSDLRNEYLQKLCREKKFKFLDNQEQETVETLLLGILKAMNKQED